MDVQKRLKQAEKELCKSREELKAYATTVRKLAEQICRERERSRAEVLANVSSTLGPVLDSLRERGAANGYVDLVERALQSLGTTTGLDLCRIHPRLTNRELEICRMIRLGYGTKRMADLLCISARGIEKHRNNIRGKLGIKKSGRSLESFLRESFQDAGPATREASPAGN